MILTFFIYLLKVSICTSVFYGFYHLVLRNENFFQLNRFFLIGAIVLSIIIPIFQMTLPSIQENWGAIYFGLDEQLINSVASTSTIKTINLWSIDTILFSIYILGALFFLAKMMGNFFYIFQLRNNNPVVKKETYSLVNLGKSHPVFSFFNLIFWNEHLDYSKDEAQQVLLHELVHVRQRHTLDIIFIEIVNVLLWFNPFIYGFKKSLKDTHEFIADQHLFQKYNFRIRYVDLLMKEAKANRNHTLPLAHSFFDTQLKKRLVMINNNQKKSNQYKLITGLPLIALLIFFFSCNKLITKSESDAMKNPEPGQIYQACDIDANGMIKLDDGTMVTIDEMKDIVVERRKAEGDPVSKDHVFIISKEEMKRNLTIIKPTNQ